MTAPDDERLSYALLFDVYALLDRYGFRAGACGTVHADALLALRRLTQAYEGRPNG